MKKLLLLLALSLCSFGARANTGRFYFPVLHGTTLVCIITDTSARTVTVVYNGEDGTRLRHKPDPGLRQWLGNQTHRPAL